MKNAAGKSKPKKKRKTSVTPRTSVNKFQSVSSPALNLRSRNFKKKSSLNNCNYVFKLTNSIKKNLRSIKRVINNGNSETPNRQLSVRNGTTSSLRFKERGHFKEDKHWLSINCSKNFLKNRSVSMANDGSTSSTSTFSNINITLDHMLNIRRKRKNFQRRSSENAECLPKLEIKECISKLTELNNQKEVQLDNSVIKKQNDDTNKNIQQQDEVNFDCITIEDSIVMNDTVTERDKENLTEVEFVDVSNDQSVIITSDPNSEKIASRKELKIRPTSNNSIITIPDTPEDITDCDIIFISEKRLSHTIPFKKRRLTKDSSVIIVDDDEDDGGKHFMKQLQIKPVTLSPSSLKSVGRRRRKKIKQKKNNSENVGTRYSQRILATVPSATKTSTTSTNKLASCSKHILATVPSATKTSSTSTSELASCADVNCINTPNSNKVSGRSTRLCACRSNRDFSKSNLDTIPEESSTTVQGYSDNNYNWSLLMQQLQPFNNTRSNSHAGNIYNATASVARAGLREIIIDGSNVALGHSNGRVFSVRGLQIAIDFFVKKGHKVTAFVPQYRVKYGQSSNPKLLQELADQRFVIFTPSREVNRKRITPYDDRYIIQYATTRQGIVVSNDNFRDLLREKPEWRNTIEKRILMHTWVDDILMFPEDPLGRHGPNLSRFLRFP